MNAVRCSKHSVLEACHFRCHIEPFSGSSGTDIVSVVSGQRRILPAMTPTVCL